MGLSLRLTLIWDVLKFFSANHKTVIISRLTLTWDVLKWQTEGTLERNLVWLTLTWDVLKSQQKKNWMNVPDD